MIPSEIRNKKNYLKSYLKSLWIDIDMINNEDLLCETFIHKSYAADYKDKVNYNERLEFLWDSALWYFIAKKLFEDNINYEESTLTLYKIALVREETLATVALNIWLDKIIFLWKWEEKNNWREKKAILADCLEALIWYLCIDLSYQIAQDFVLKYIYSQMSNIDSLFIRSYKTKLQESVQKIYKELPVYLDFDFEKDTKWNVITYKSQVLIHWELMWEWLWINKKNAQELAAKDAYYKFIKLQNILDN